MRQSRQFGSAKQGSSARQLRSSRPWRVAVAPIAACLFTTLALTGISSPTPAGAAPPTGTLSAAAAAELAASGSGCPGGTAAGATSKQVTLAISIINISGGSLTNATVGVPSAQVQEDYWNLVAKNINHSGGAGCRKLALKFFDVNPIDPAAAQQVCLQIAASQPFMELDSGALTDIGASDCIPGHKIPLESQYLTQAEITTYYPYYLQLGDVPNDTLRNGILGLKQLGYFSSSKGFKKLGLLYHTCTPGLLTAQSAALKQAGVSTSKIVTFNLGCPTGQVDTPASMQQAVLSFKNAGVTDVTEVGVNDWGIFTQVAEQQNFTPKYVLDDGAIPTGVTTGADAPNPSNLSGAVDVIASGYGEQTTPGYKPSGGTEKCNAIFTAAKQPTVYKQLDGYGGVVCDYLWFVQALLNHTKSIQTSTLAKNMRSIGTIDFSYPESPIDYSAAPAGSAYGVSYWRAVDYVVSCKCWQIPNPTFHPPFK